MLDIWGRFNAQVLATKRDEALEHERQAERRRQRYKGPRKPWDLNRQRRVEIEKVIRYRHNGPCDTDDAEAYLLAVLPHLLRIHAAEDARAAVVKWARTWTPTLEARCVAGLADEALAAEPRPLKADPIGMALKVSNAERTVLRLKTIGACDRTKRQRTADRKRRNAERQREKRACSGATPRAQSKATTQPWRALGIGRSAYYERERRKKDTITTVTEPDRTISSPIVRSTYTLMADRPGLQDQAVSGPARRASPNQSVGADGPSPRDKLRVVQASLTRALPLPDKSISEQPDLLDEWQPLAAAAQAVLRAYMGGTMPIEVVHAVHHKRRAKLMRLGDVARRVGISRPQLSNALHQRFGLSQSAAANLREWLAA